MILQMNHCLFIYRQPNRTPENDPELNKHSQEGTSDTKDYRGKKDFVLSI